MFRIIIIFIIFSSHAMAGVVRWNEEGLKNISASSNIIVIGTPKDINIDYLYQGNVFTKHQIDKLLHPTTIEVSSDDANSSEGLIQIKKKSSVSWTLIKERVSANIHVISTLKGKLKSSNSFPFTATSTYGSMCPHYPFTSVKSGKKDIWFIKSHKNNKVKINSVVYLKHLDQINRILKNE